MPANSHRGPYRSVNSKTRPCPIKRCEIYNLCVENLALNRLRVNATLASRCLNSRIGAMQHIEERSSMILGFLCRKGLIFQHDEKLNADVVL